MQEESTCRPRIFWLSFKLNRPRLLFYWDKVARRAHLCPLLGFRRIVLARDIVIGDIRTAPGLPFQMQDPSVSLH